MYSDYFRNAPADSPSPPNGLQPQYRISLTLAVTDGRALWTAAAARLLGTPGMTLDDVVEVIGPCEDPSISDCIAALAKPTDLPGCVLDDFWIDGLGGCPPRLETSAAQRDSQAEGAERPVRRSATRRTVAPALHLLVGAASAHRSD